MVRSGGLWLLLLAVAGCPGPVNDPTTIPAGRTDVDPERAARRCAGLAGEAKPSSGDAENDLYQVFRNTGGIARLRKAWHVGGAGSVHTLLEGGVKLEGARCAVLAAVVGRDDEPAVVPIGSEPDHGRLVFAGALDLAGCRRSMATRPRQRVFDSSTVTQIAHMRRPALAFWAGDRLRFYSLGGGRVTMAAELQPNYSSENGKYEAINSIEIAPDEEGAVARWEDVFHPDEPRGRPTSPVAKSQQERIPLRAPAPGPASEPLEATRSRVAAALGVDEVGEIQMASTRLPDHDGWLFAHLARDEARHIAVGRFTALYCGGVAIDALTDLGPAAAVQWAAPIRLDRPVALVPGDTDRSLPLAALDDAAQATEPRGTRYERTDRGEGRDEHRQGRHSGLVVITNAPQDDSTLHLISDRHGLIWQQPSPLPARIEVAHGPAEMPYILAAGRIYRFDGDRYRADAGSAEK